MKPPPVSDIHAAWFVHETLLQARNRPGKRSCRPTFGTATVFPLSRTGTVDSGYRPSRCRRTPVARFNASGRAEVPRASSCATFVTHLGSRLRQYCPDELLKDLRTKLTCVTSKQDSHVTLCSHPQLSESCKPAIFLFLFRYKNFCSSSISCLCVHHS